MDFSGKSVIQRTGAGTQGIVAVTGAERLYAASLVTASATTRALLASTPKRITLVAMGNRAVVRTDEDEICAIHMRNRLEGRTGDIEAVRRLILAGGEIAHFHDPARPHMHPADLDIALDVDRYNFAIRVWKEPEGFIARREAPP